MKNISHALPTVSIVIAAYNEEKCIAEALDNIKKQTVQPYELIVVDNNSVDKTAKIAKKFGARVIKESKQGNIFAMHKGMSVAQGDVIAVTDADTKPDPKWVETIQQTFCNREIVGLTGSIHESSKSLLLSFLIDTSYLAFLKLHFIFGRSHLSGFNFAVRRSTFMKAGGLNLKYKMSADVDLGLRLVHFGKVILVKRAVVSTSTRRWKKGIPKAFLQYATSYFYAMWLRKPPPIQQQIIR